MLNPGINFKPRLFCVAQSPINVKPRLNGSLNITHLDGLVNLLIGRLTSIQNGRGRSENMLTLKIRHEFDSFDGFY